MSKLNISNDSTFDDTSTKYQYYREISPFNTRAIAGGTSCPLFYFSSCRCWRVPGFVTGNNPRLSRFSWIIIEWKMCRRTVKSLWVMKNNKIWYNPKSILQRAFKFIHSHLNKLRLNLLPCPIIFVTLNDGDAFVARFLVDKQGLLSALHPDKIINHFVLIHSMYGKISIHEYGANK